jgi:hypothetical protein
MLLRFHRWHGNKRSEPSTAAWESRMLAALSVLTQLGWPILYDTTEIIFFFSSRASSCPFRRDILIPRSTRLSATRHDRIHFPKGAATRECPCVMWRRTSHRGGGVGEAPAALQTPQGAPRRRGAPLTSLFARFFICQVMNNCFESGEVGMC